MAVVSIKSVIECDECAARFTVLHDPAYSPPADWSLWDVAEDAVRGGYVEGKSIFDGSCSVQDGRMLCIPCTRRADAADEEPECAACDGSGKIVEPARTEGINQHSACQRDCEDCGGTGRTPNPQQEGR